MKERNINEMTRFLPGLILFKILKKKVKTVKTILSKPQQH